MLKIKDNIDLKELEKFGLKLRYACDEETGITSVSIIYAHTKRDNLLYSIKFVNYSGVYILEYTDIDGWGILYDLIKADLVEKVDSNER